MTIPEARNQSIQHWIRAFIQGVVKTQTKPWYRTPRVGFVPAHHPGFKRLREVVAPDHKLPHDILTQARSVVAFFIPFSLEIVRENARTPSVARSWTEADVCGKCAVQRCAFLEEGASEGLDRERRGRP